MIEKKIITVLLGGLLIGFFIGKKTNSSSSKNHPPKLHSHSKKTKANSSKEKKMLLDALAHLNLTTEELQKARAYIHTLERNNKRYHWLLRFCRKNMADELNWWGMGVGDDGFNPSPATIEFFGWDQETVDQIARIGTNTWNRILDWEEESAIQIQAKNGKLVYEIPALPASIKNEYLQEMQSILGKEDMELLSNGLNEQFSSVENSRRVEFSVDSSPGSSMISLPNGASISSVVSSGPTHLSSFINKGETNKSTKWVHIKTTTSNGEGLFIETYEANSDSFGRWTHLFNPTQLGL